MPKSKAEKLKEIIQLLNEGGPSAEDLKRLINALVVAVRDVKAKLERQNSQLYADSAKKLNKLASDLTNSLTKITTEQKKESEKALKDANRLFKTLEAEINKVRNQIPDLSIIYRQIQDLEIPTEDELLTNSNIRKKAEEIRDALEGLKDEYRLDVSAIRGLDKKLDQIKKMFIKSSGGGVRRVFQPYLQDFTADTDGANKTFYLNREPLRTDTIEVHCTDWPIILRPTVDFTVAGRTLTLTNEVDAPSNGATLLIKYYA